MLRVSLGIEEHGTHFSSSVSWTRAATSISLASSAVCTACERWRRRRERGEKREEGDERGRERLNNIEERWGTEDDGSKGYKRFNYLLSFGLQGVHLAPKQSLCLSPFTHCLLCGAYSKNQSLERDRGNGQVPRGNHLAQLGGWSTCCELPPEPQHVPAAH